MVLGTFQPLYAIEGLDYHCYPLPDVDTGPLTAALCVALHFVVDCAMLLFLYLSMQRRTRDRDQQQRECSATLTFKL